MLISEKAEDLSIDKSKSPLAYNIHEMWIQYLDTNPILDNGQMIYIQYEENIRDRISEYFQRMLIEYIESEKTFNRCKNIIEEYGKNNINNTSSFVKISSDIILSMDKVNKYVWNITKLLVDDVKEYKKFEEWQEGKIKIDKTIRNDLQQIYLIRNEFEHPEKLNTTFFKKENGKIILPKIIFRREEYDLFELTAKSLNYTYIVSKNIVGAAFLYSKYVKMYTDKTRKILYAK